jgi:hypothetical protein
MRTDVRISFDGNDIPGGATAVLGPARCDPDVATVEDVPVLRQVVVRVTLEVMDPRLPVVLQLLKQHGAGWLEWHQDRYTDEELDRARLIVMKPRNDHEVFGGPRMGTKYALENACPVCGAGARQTSALIIDGEGLPTLEGLRAASTYYSDILMDEPLAEELENTGAIGVSFRSVYAVMEDKRQVKLRWRQLCAAHTLPPMSPRSTGVERWNPGVGYGSACASCGRSGFSSIMNDPARLVYRAQDLSRAEDVNTTWEWFGDWKFNGDVSEALFAYPWFLVTPKVQRVFRAAGVTAFDWLPIRVEDAAE